jgi:hypothetical protein
MKFAIGLIGLALVAIAQCGLVSVVPGTTTLLGTPHLDSAVINSERVNGNFAYSTVEGHAYQAITPVVHGIRVFKSGIEYPITRRFSGYSGTRLPG